MLVVKSQKSSFGQTIQLIGWFLLGFSMPVLSTDALPPGVSVVAIGVGDLYLSSGAPLYAYRRDERGSGKSTCNGACADIWPPFLASENVEDAEEEAEEIEGWSVIARDDGKVQWAYRGRPVYTNVHDSVSGSLIGEKDAFWDPVIDPIVMPRGVGVKGTFAGQTLMDADGMTLYWNISPGDCKGDCLANVTPLEAAWTANPPSESWSITRTAGGLRQWAYKGRALYTSRNDYQSEDTYGVNSDLGWEAAVIQKAPPIPGWVSFQESDLGPVLADQNGMTLYSVALEGQERIRRTTCDEACVAANWRPVMASDSARSLGNWSVVEAADGDRHWHYLGLALYTYVNDLQPGHTYGEKFGAGVSVRGGWTAISKESMIQKFQLDSLVDP